mmetsp:Transcript_28411/g.45616  ORF Transcript_28411/g.45616 Transcript_28411/m.45616 type:complete len:216 (+) Transcript_28411:34-681(+)
MRQYVVTLTVLARSLVLLEAKTENSMLVNFLQNILRRSKLHFVRHLAKLQPCPKLRCLQRSRNFYHRSSLHRHFLGSSKNWLARSDHLDLAALEPDQPAMEHPSYFRAPTIRQQFGYSKNHRQGEQLSLHSSPALPFRSTTLYQTLRLCPIPSVNMVLELPLVQTLFQTSFLSFLSKRSPIHCLCWLLSPITLTLLAFCRPPLRELVRLPLHSQT